MSRKQKRTPSPVTESRRIMPREIVGIAALLLLGGWLRFAKADQMAVEHFDEGVYASNVWFEGTQVDRYPMQHLYAPPLLPAAIEWVVLFGGPQVPMPMLVNLVAGTLTIVAVWWTGRTWLGSVGGITAASLCAFSDFHVLYSRTALTDPLLCLWLVAAVFCIGEGHRKLSLRWLLAGGLFTGLAWWTKYNGWLPLAIQFSGVAGWLIFGGREARRKMSRHLLGFVATAGTAVVIWLPVWKGLQPHGGYEVVAANHRGYLVGLSGWWDSLQRQYAAHQFLEGLVAVFGVAYAAIWAVCLRLRFHEGGFTWNTESGKDAASRRFPAARFVLLLGAATLLAGLAVAFGTSLLLAVLTLAGFAQVFLMRRADNAADRLPVWLLAAWFVGLMVATPFYRAYPRLSLPWLVAAWFGAGLCFERAATWLQSLSADEKPSPGSKWIVGGVGLLAAGAVLFFVGSHRFAEVRVPGWQNRGGFRPIAKEIVARSESQTADDEAHSPGSGNDPNSDPPRFVIYVFGEPGLFYELSLQRKDSSTPFLVHPVATRNVKPARWRETELPTFLVTGPHFYRGDGAEPQDADVDARLQPIGKTFRYRASDLVLLNSFSTSELTDPERSPKLAVRLFRVRW